MKVEGVHVGKVWRRVGVRYDQKICYIFLKLSKNKHILKENNKS